MDCSSLMIGVGIASCPNESLLLMSDEASIPLLATLGLLGVPTGVVTVSLLLS